MSRKKGGKLTLAGCTGAESADNNKHMVDKTQNDQQEATESLSPDIGADNQRLEHLFSIPSVYKCVDCSFKKEGLLCTVCMYTSPVHIPNTNCHDSLSCDMAANVAHRIQSIKQYTNTICCLYTLPHNLGAIKTCSTL